MGDAEIGSLDGKTVVVWSRYKKRSLNQSALRETHPEIAEEFTELKEQRTFKLVDDND
jgi:hypothetical protein